jgi:hypothetical protein
MCSDKWVKNAITSCLVVASISSIRETSNSTSLAFHTASAFYAGIIPILAIASQACASISYHILNFVLGDHISTISGRE